MADNDRKTEDEALGNARASLVFTALGLLGIGSGLVTSLWGLADGFMVVVGFFVLLPIGLYLAFAARKKGMSRKCIITSWIGIAASTTAIVSILAALVIEIQRAPEAARKAACANNMKELGLSLAMYCGDHDAHLPGSYLWGQSGTWSQDNFKSFAGERGTIPPEPADIHKSWPELLYPYMRNKDVMWCSSDPAAYRSDCGKVSYYWKAAVDRAWYAGAMKDGDFDFPSAQMIFYEHNGWHWQEQDKGLTDGVRINCTFLDGHVRNFAIRDSAYASSENPPSPVPESGSGEPAWFNCCGDPAADGVLTARGQNWDPHKWCDKLDD